MDDFNGILNQFTQAVEEGDGAALGSLFTPDGVYEDCFYGTFTGRSEIQTMLEDHFWKHATEFRWRMFEPVVANGIGYARYRFSYVSKIAGAEGRSVLFEGMSQFSFEGSLIARYREVFNTGMALSQLGFSASRIHRHLEKQVERLIGT